MPDTELTTVSTDEFVEAIRRSDVVEETTLDGALAHFAESLDPDAEPLDIEPTELAKYLLNARVLTRYQAKELLQGRFRRLRMEHFVILDLLGVGGMGAVFRALDKKQDKEVALKVLSERFKHDAGMRARFRLEARAGMKLDHPGIVRTYEISVSDELFGEVDYATMEMFEGVALHELVGIMGPIPVNAACDIVCQAADALEYLHEQGMVHRDVKPDNILVDRDGHVKVIDFGLALVDEEDVDKPSEKEEFSLAMIFGHDCLGTPDYMPPEQADDGSTADARSDVYSLGCTLYLALTASRPFRAKTGAELLTLHREAQPPDPRQVVEKTPPEVARAVLKMMAKYPADRFQSMAAVREALERFAVQRRIDFSFSTLLRNRMALAIKQGRISQRKTSTVMRLSNAGRHTIHRGILSGDATGSAAALQATDTARDTAIGRAQSRRLAGKSDSKAGQPHDASAASGAEALLGDLNGATADSQAATSGAMLKLPDGGLYRLNHADIVIGRDREQSDLQIDNRRLSARHCRLSYQNDQWKIIDLESTNGTQLNGKPVAIAPIFGKDCITLGGEVTLTVDWSRQRAGSHSSKTWAIALGIFAAVIAGLVALFVW